MTFLLGQVYPEVRDYHYASQGSQVNKDSSLSWHTACQVRSMVGL